MDGTRRAIRDSFVGHAPGCFCSSCTHDSFLPTDSSPYHIGNQFIPSSPPSRRFIAETDASEQEAPIRRQQYDDEYRRRVIRDQEDMDEYISDIGDSDGDYPPETYDELSDTSSELSSSADVSTNLREEMSPAQNARLRSRAQGFGRFAPTDELVTPAGSLRDHTLNFGPLPHAPEHPKNLNTFERIYPRTRLPRAPIPTPGCPQNIRHFPRPSPRQNIRPNTFAAQLNPQEMRRMSRRPKKANLAYITSRGLSGAESRRLR